MQEMQVQSLGQKDLEKEMTSQYFIFLNCCGRREGRNPVSTWEEWQTVNEWEDRQGTDCLKGPYKLSLGHFSILDWEIPWTEKPGGLQSLKSQRLRHDLRD